MSDLEIKDLPEQTTLVSTDKHPLQDASGISKYALSSTHLTYVINNMWWQEIGRTTLAVAGDTITVSFTAKKYLTFIFYGNASGGTLDTQVTFNGDTAANYAIVFSAAFASPATSTPSAQSFAFESGATDSGGISSGEMKLFANVAAEEKNVTWWSISQDAAGAGTVPVQLQGFGKWANTSAQVTSVTWNNGTGTGDFAIGSEVVVLGHD